MAQRIPDEGGRKAQASQSNPNPWRRRDPRAHDRLGRRDPRQLLVTPLQVLAAFPGIAGAFRTQVPPEHLDGDAVLCTCGARTEITRPAFVQCSGECGRWFLRVRAGEVRVAREEP